MKITVVGTGYVGLVTGVCFAEMGNDVVCIDTDIEKIVNLNRCVSPIYEPGLDDLVKRNSSAGRIQFSTDSKSGVALSEIIFIAVGTPSDTDGSSDLRFVLSVAKTIGQFMNSEKIIVNKSTVPVGTAELVRQQITAELQQRRLNLSFHIVSNPEFLKEGTAIQDCLRPNRVVIGTDSRRAEEILHKLYRPFFPKDETNIIFMDLNSAEMTKYAANAMLATKISFMNELSRLCERVDVDIEQVRVGIGSDPRIGSQFLYAGIGYGGSCFPKDVRALLKTAQANDESLSILQAVETVNERQRVFLIKKIDLAMKGQFQNKTIALWGLAFKPGTDDIREAPSLDVIEYFTDRGARVVTYDPVAMENVKKHFKDKAEDRTLLSFSLDQYDALSNADFLIIVTEWKSFREPNFEKMKELLKSGLIFDGRNLYEPKEMAELGFVYHAIGRPSPMVRT